MAGFTKNFVKRELIMTMKSHNNNFFRASCLHYCDVSKAACGLRKLQTSKAPLESQAQGTSLFTSAASNQRVFPKNSPWEAQVRLPEGERMRQIRGVFQRIVR